MYAYVSNVYYNRCFVSCTTSPVFLEPLRVLFKLVYRY